MSFARLDAALNATVFSHLADDRASSWMRGPALIGHVPVILDRIENATSQRGLASIERANVARLPIVVVENLLTDGGPEAGDVLTVNGRALVIHGTPWKDEEEGLDWLCPVNG